MRKLSFFIFTCLFVFSCHTEPDNITRNYDESLTPSSPLISLISRVCQNATACDNVLDGTSCFSVQLPVDIIVNGQKLHVESNSDFAEITAIKDQSDTDDDIVHFTFPITVVFVDSQHTVINNQQQLNTLSTTCVATDFHEISCISFNFPFSINLYNTNSQSATSITFINNQRLYTFLNTLSESDLISIVYPISVTASDGHSNTINNNTELENAITEAIEDCELSTNPLDIATTLTSGTWYISYFFNVTEETYIYNGFNFTFLPNGMLRAIKNETIITGNWELDTHNGHQRLDFNFDESSFHELEFNWKIIEFTGTDIHLSNDNGGGGPGPGNPSGNRGNHYLYLTKN